MSLKTASNIRALTSIRGIAAWWVVAYHFQSRLPLENLHLLQKIINLGYLAVDLFFVLSGFVIYLNYGNWFLSLRREKIRAFLTARIARIYPLHAFMLLMFLLNPIALALFSHGNEIGHRYDLTYFLLSVILIHNWGLTHALAWNIPSWSISTEWFAYLTFPIFSYFVARYSLRTLGVLVWLFSFLFLLAAIFWLAGLDSMGDNIVLLGLPRCVLEFLAGACVCQLYLRFQARFNDGSLLIIMAAILVSVAVIFRVPDYMVAPLCCCLVVLGLTGRVGWPVRLLSARPLVFLGEISYSTYMVHYFVKDWSSFLSSIPDQPSVQVSLGCFVVIFMASVALHRLVELPGRQLLSPKRAASTGGPIAA